MHRWTFIAMTAAVLGGGIAWYALKAPTRTGVDDTSSQESGHAGADDTDADLLQGSDVPVLKGRPATSPAAKIAGSVTGRVVDGKSGTPIPNAQVAVFRTGKQREFHVGKTDVEGRFEIASLAAGTWWIVAVHPSYMPPGLVALAMSKGVEPPAMLRLEIPAGEAPPEERVFRLYPGVTVRGRVVDADGQPVAGAQVLVDLDLWIKELASRLQADLSDWRDYVQVVSDADGAFSFSYLPPVVKTIRLGARKDGFVGRWSDALETADGIDATLTLVRPATVAGTLRFEDGSPAGPLKVKLALRHQMRKVWLFDAATVMADELGRYRFEGLPPHWLVLESDWADPYMNGVMIAVSDLKPGEVREDVDLIVPRRYLLRVRVRTASGAPLEDAVILVGREAPEEESEEEEQYTSADGTAAFALPSAGPYQMNLRTMEKDVVVQTGLLLPHELIEVTGTAPRTTRVELRVISHDGMPLEGCATRVHSMVGMPARNREYFRSRRGTGNPTVHALIGGAPFMVEVDTRKATRPTDDADKADVIVHALPASGIVDVRLPAPGVLTGTVLDVYGRPIVGARIRATLHDIDGDDEEARDEFTIAVRSDGTFSHPTAPSPKGSKRRIRVVAPRGYSVSESVRFDRGSPVHHFVLQAGGVIAGMVYAPEGVKIEGTELLSVSWAPKDDDPASLPWDLEIALDADGSFEVVGVPVDRPLTLVASASFMRAHGLQPVRPLTNVQAGQRSLSITLVSGLDIQGNVRFVGAAPPQVKIYMNLEDESADGHDLVLANLSANGQFEIKGLRPGSYRLRIIAERDDGWSVLATRIVRAGQTVTLDVGKRGSIRVTQPDSSKWVVLTAWKRGAPWPVATMLFNEKTDAVLVDLPVGERFDLVVEVPGGPSGAVRDVVVGSTVDVALAKRTTIGGVLKSERDYSYWSLVARGSGSSHRLVVGEGNKFKGTLAPGIYDFILISPFGSDQVVARGINAGQADLTFEAR